MSFASDLVKLYPSGLFDPTRFYCQKLDLTVVHRQVAEKEEIALLSGGMFVYTEIESHFPQIRIEKRPSTHIHSISNANGPHWVYIANRFRDLQGKCLGSFREGSHSDRRNPYIVLSQCVEERKSLNNVDLVIFCVLLLEKQLRNRIKKSNRKYKQLVRRYGPFQNDV
ncbi:hypothetical protein E3P92_02689 [Wallemia ichthyophaga]|uniref:Uncharacterized protein n=1 Tax=Wallemia ichthyophaga TaxID=245174 RepID=A0A4T0H815_WALIC|nr:hypothetical protein E3P91_02962 [Wallemia ichthyophaga]TIA80007.1 hypothetical protein E3P98_02955 [Wallemia ichthyophaga]TIA88989.1 hypothetical protein E3P97_03306 [Wallemia ichthyophaga]TIA95139.1 hypothetical protein E3P96_03911 [Wallemia ichthyophaga]TIA97815.1 hypothetical protein E3P94_03189 [Wallemia ichthyophaga]